MKKLLIVLAFSSFLLNSCVDVIGCLDCDQKAAFQVTPPDLYFYEDALTGTFYVQGTVDWQLINLPAGYSFSPTSGPMGKIAVAVTCTDFVGGGKVDEVWVQGSDKFKKKVTLHQLDGTPYGYAVDPESIFLPYGGTSGDPWHVEVYLLPLCDPTKPWTLTSEKSWLTLSLNPDGSGASSSVSGSGASTTVYLVATANNITPPAVRQSILTLGYGADDCIVKQDVDPATIPGYGTLISVNTYIGAFWRANETGERIIRVRDMNNTTAHRGPWKAEVVFRDARWNQATGDGIVLSTVGVSLPELNGRGVYTPTPDDPETHQVPGTLTVVTGEVTAADPDILFRIGLQKRFTDSRFDPNDPNYTTTWPARYAVVLLTYGNSPVKYQKIFLRQGEGADYVMRDATRPYAVKFLPYNLTAAATNAQVSAFGAIDEYNASMELVPPACLTNYPTKAGAFFQWANKWTRTRFAWDPFTVGVPAPGWDATVSWSNPNDYWTGPSMLILTNETCPPGYRRPSDGTTSGMNSTYLAADSEIRQSLWLNPQDGCGSAASSTTNVPWGFYADGFFDRLPLENGPAYSTTAASFSSVSVDNKDIAHKGCLFFNPQTYASLFFPAAGNRQNNTAGTVPGGVLNNAGATGYYWTSSSRDNTYSLSLVVSSWAVYMQNANARNQGSNIRCVQSPMPM